VAPAPVLDPAVGQRQTSAVSEVTRAADPAPRADPAPVSDFTRASGPPPVSDPAPVTDAPPGSVPDPRDAAAAAPAELFDWDAAVAPELATSVGAAPETFAPVAVPVAGPDEAKSQPRSPRKPKPVKARPAERRFRQTVQRVDLWSVTKLSLCFYTSAMFVFIVALVTLWVIADSAGIIGSVESFIGDLLSSKDFHFLSADVLRGAVLVVLVIDALLVVLTIVAASFYNIFAELFGGLEITIKEEESTAKY
jgi:hypothetical protein